MERKNTSEKNIHTDAKTAPVKTLYNVKNNERLIACVVGMMSIASRIYGVVLPCMKRFAICATVLAVLSVYVGAIAWSFTPYSGAMVVVGISFLPAFLLLGIACEAAERTAGVGGVVALITASLFLGLVWYPAAGSVGDETIRRLYGDALEQVRKGGCARSVPIVRMTTGDT